MSRVLRGTLQHGRKMWQLAGVLLAAIALAGVASDESCAPDSDSLNSKQCLSLDEHHVDLSPLAG